MSRKITTTNKLIKTIRVSEEFYKQPLITRATVIHYNVIIVNSISSNSQSIYMHAINTL